MIKINASNILRNGIALYNLYTSFKPNSRGLGNNFAAGGENVSLSNRTTSSDIWTFISSFENGVAKPTKYRIEFNLPKGAVGTNVNKKSTPANIRNIERDLNKKDVIAIKCHTMSLPRRGFNTIEVSQNNIRYKLPFGISYEPVTFSFYADSRLDTLRYFDIWQAAIMNYSDNTVNFLDEYTADINLYILNDEGKDVYGVKLVEAYPSNIAPVEMSYGNVNNLLTVNVTFNFKYFLTDDSTQLISRTY